LHRPNLLAVGLVCPALLLILLAFMLPLASNLATAVRDPELSETLPRSAAMLRDWDGAGLPGESVFASVARELSAAEADRRVGSLARRLNFERSGLRSLLLRTARADLAAPYRAAMTALDARWAELSLWRMLRRDAAGFTPLYLLRSVDLDVGETGAVVALGPEQAIFRDLFARTFEIGLVVTLLCVLFGYPAAYVLATAPAGWARVGLALVLVPFWISILVRSTAWFILLQRDGPVNGALLASGLISQPLRLIFTRFAVYLAMTHVLLPFLILPLYGTMRRIDPAYLRAAASLGATGPQRFLRVYLPLTLPGVATGALVVFMLSVGFYITPALVGGNGDQMVSAFIAQYANVEINWGMAAALAVVLLALTGVVVGVARALLPRGPMMGRL